MEKRVLLTELVDKGSHIRKEITPTAVVTDQGKYPAGMFWDANKTLKEIVAGATDAQDTLKEIEDKLNAEINRASDAEQSISDQIDDILGIDAEDIQQIKDLIEDLDSETGILPIIQNKVDSEEFEQLIDDISTIDDNQQKVLGTTITQEERTRWNNKSDQSDTYTKAEIDQMVQDIYTLIYNLPHNVVGTGQIINDSIALEDLSDEVKDKLQDITIDEEEENIDFG